MKIRPIFKTYELGNYFWGGSANAICELYARKKVEMLFAWAEHLLLMTIALCQVRYKILVPLLSNITY